VKLSVHVQGREVALLEPLGDFKSVLAYGPHTAADDFVSLTMPVRTESYAWDDQLHPIFQMNLPEGYLLQVLQEQFGPHVGADPIALLSVIGRNTVGRVQVAAPGADLNAPAKAIEVAELLRGDNSEAAFAELVRQHATSGVSGVLPKFLDSDATLQSGESASTAKTVQHRKVSFLSGRHIIKGSTSQLPFAALNEHLSMQVAAKVMPSARTEVSLDGNALVVERFDLDEEGRRHWGMEDFCALLGMRPSAKYETTWERIARAVRDHVPGNRQHETFRRLATTLLLTYALRNADCHAKNLALLYTSRADVHIAPAYDFLTTSVYAGYQHNPPGISFLGKRTWMPGKTLSRFIAGIFGVPLREQAVLLESISDAVAEVVPLVRAKMEELPRFRETGKRMLLAWQEGVEGLRSQRVYAAGEWPGSREFQGLSDPARLENPTSTIGRSPLLGRRSGQQK
jgi:serine/threonine-protein kinase HipA